MFVLFLVKPQPLAKMFLMSVNVRFVVLRLFSPTPKEIKKKNNYFTNIFKHHKMKMSGIYSNVLILMYSNLKIIKKHVTLDNI